MKLRRLSGKKLHQILIENKENLTEEAQELLQDIENNSFSSFDDRYFVNHLEDELHVEQDEIHYTYKHGEISSGRHTGKVEKSWHMDVIKNLR